MVSKEEKRKRRSLIREIKQAEMKESIADMPISVHDLKNLFDWLDEQLSFRACDQTLKQTLTFIKDENLHKENVVPWLNSYGGYCDCEVLANVENELGETLEKLN
jgi:hypothetical protein